MKEKQDNLCMGAIGDPDETLCVATAIMAMQRMRTAGLPGPFEYRLTVDQVNDIEPALVAGADDGGRLRPTFRGIPVIPSGVDINSRIVDVPTGRWLAILSRSAGMPDLRKADLGERQAMALKWEAAEHREMFKAHAPCAAVGAGLPNHAGPTVPGSR